MKWFKFYGSDYLNDPKILSLTAAERSCWITLLSFFSTVNDNGAALSLKFLSEDTLLRQSGIEPFSEEWKKTVGILKRFNDLQMITLDNGLINVKNWNKRQEVSLTPYERVKRYRQKKRNDNSNDHVVDIDKEVDIDNILPASSEKPPNGTNEKDMKKYNESASSDSYEPSVDLETGEIEEEEIDTTAASMKSLLQWAVARRGRPFVNIPKQYKAMKKLKSAKVSPSEIKSRWEEMENDKFYKQNGFDFMTLASSFDRKIT